MVDGNLITQDKIKPVTVAIPSIIINFSNPRKRTSRKIIKAISEQLNTVLINEVNQFNQHMIMEMLSSSAKTRTFVPGYSIYNSNEISEIMQNSEILLLPETANGRKALYTNSDIIKSKKRISSKKRWLVLDNPNISQQNGEMTVFKLHAIRESKDKWNVLPLSNHQLENGTSSELANTLYKSTLKIAECIGNFISLLSFCTVSFALDENHSPFLVNFSGWDPSLILKKQNLALLELFAKKFLMYSDLLLNSKGEKDYVD